MPDLKACTPFKTPVCQRLGYTLIELAVVVAALALVFGSMLSVATMRKIRENNAKIVERFDIIEDALENYVNQKGHLPCPASLTEPENTPTYGRVTDCSVAAAGTTDTGAGTDAIRIGAVPMRSLSIADTYMYDPWGNRITYSAIKDLAKSGTTYDNYSTALNTGVIQITDYNGNQVNSDDPGTVIPYVLLSHGPDIKGAYNRLGQMVTACDTGTKDGENCDNNDTAFMDTDIVDSNTANNYDDYARWRDWAALKTKTSASPASPWQIALGGTNDDYLMYGLPTSDGGYILSGYTDSYGAGNNDALLIKLDRSGNVTWAKTLGGAQDDDFHSVVETSTGDFVAVGSTYSYSAGADDGWIAKFDSAGNLQWVKTVGSSIKREALLTAQATSDGAIIVSGRVGATPTNTDAFIAKYNTNGNRLWAKTIGVANHDVFHVVYQTSDGGYVAAGYTRSYGPGLSAHFVVKFNASGVKQWGKWLGNTGDSISFAVSQLTNGNIVVGGYTEGYGAGGKDIWLHAFDSTTGATQWSRTLGGTGDDMAHTLSVMANGNILMSGATQSYGAGSWDGIVAAFNTSGTLQWSKTLGSTSQDSFDRGFPAGSNGFIFAGDTDSYGAGGHDAWVAAFDANANCCNTTSQALTAQNVTPTEGNVAITENNFLGVDVSQALTAGTVLLTKTEICP